MARKLKVKIDKNKKKNIDDLYEFYQMCIRDRSTTEILYQKSYKRRFG